MTNFKLFLTSLIISLFSCFFLITCSDDNSTSSGSASLIGSWELTKLTVESNGVKMEFDPSDVDFALTLTINDDGTYSITENDEGDITNLNGTWTRQGDKITIVEQGVTQEITYTLQGNKLIFMFEEEEEGFIVNITQEFIRKIG